MTDSTQATSSSTSYKVFRRLPPFYTIQPQIQTQAKQLSCWSDFILDAAVACYHQTGALGIQVTPHSALFKSPKQVQRHLPSSGARLVLKTMMENTGGHRCLPLSLEDADDGNNNNNDIQEVEVVAQDDDEDDFEDAGSPARKISPQSPQSIFANCDALVVLALPCEKILKSIWSWHEETQTSSVFSVSELAEDNDIKKRIAKLVAIPSTTGTSGDSTNDVGLLILGESISCDNNNNIISTNQLLHITPLSMETVIETIMTTEHPAMAHLKRPSLLSSSSGSLGLKFS
jgi:hypothetical protein